MDTKDNTEDEISKYLKLDLADFKTHLMDGLAGEAAAVHGLQITATHENPASGLTPHARSSFGTYIASLRTKAISKADTDASAIPMEGKDHGIIQPLEEQKARHNCTSKIANAAHEFQNGQTVSTLIGQCQKSKDKSDRLRNSEDREAKVPNRWLIWFVGLLILLPEGFINYESIRMAPLVQSALVATGLTLIVGAVIAAASYCIGTYIRHYNYYYRGMDRDRKNTGMSYLGLGIFALVLGLAVVGYFRYTYVTSKIAEAIALGNVPPNITFAVAGLLLGNVICFLLGVIVFFFMHDSNPEYENAERSLRKNTKKLTKYQNKLDNRVAEIKRRLESDLNTITTKSQTMRTKPGYSALLQRFHDIQAKDNEVVAALQGYNKSLATVLPHGFSISMNDYASANLMNTLRHLEVREFASYPIHLHMASA